MAMNERERVIAANEIADSVRTDRCTGASSCVAPTHVHGCFADLGNCDDPNDHPEPDAERGDRG